MSGITIDLNINPLTLRTLKKITHHNEHFDISTLDTSLEVEAWQRSQRTAVDRLKCNVRTAFCPDIV